MTYQVDILNPKALRLLNDLVDQKLIAISDSPIDPFLKVVDKLRKKAGSNPPGLEEITREVESVRAERYAKSKA